MIKKTWLLLLVMMSILSAFALDKGTLYLKTGMSFDVELAIDQEDRARGMMGRTELAENKGMLFLFEVDDWHGFWMKNCKISLDLIWLDSDFKVVFIEHNMEPCPDNGPCPTIAPMMKSRHVLELAAGVAHSQKITVGTKFAFVQSE